LPLIGLSQTNITYHLLPVLGEVKTSKKGEKTFQIIDYINNEPVINLALIDSLPDFLKAITTYYSCAFGTTCYYDTCQLTKALHLGKQGSEKQENILTSWFDKKDQRIHSLLFHNCYQAHYNSEKFTQIFRLTYKVYKNKISSHIWVMKYERGDITHYYKTDKFLVLNNKIQVKKRFKL
jgi:hypothetical protein